MENKKVKAKKNDCLYLTYGINTSRVYIKPGQIWTVIYATTDFIGLNNGIVDIEISHEYFRKLFTEVEKSA